MNYVPYSNVHLWTWDFFAILIVIALVALWFYTKGRDFIVTTILGAYIAVAIITLAPLLSNFYVDFGLAEYEFKFIFFMLLSLLFTWIMANNGYFEPYVVPSSWEVPVFVVLFSGLLVAIAVSFMPVDVYYHLSPITRQVFSNHLPLTAWLLAPMLALLLIRGRA